MRHGGQPVSMLTLQLVSRVSLTVNYSLNCIERLEELRELVECNCGLFILAV